jgi:hypothetical protein
MKSNAKYILYLFILSACATPVTTMQRNGDVVSCGGEREWSAALGYAGYNIQRSHDRDCVDGYRQQGYSVLSVQSDL